MLNREWLLLSMIMRMRMMLLLMMMVVMGMDMLMLMLMGMTEQMVGGEWLQSAMVRVDPAVGEFKHCPPPSFTP